GVGVGNCPVVVGGQGRDVVTALVERDRAAAQELQAGGRDHVVGRLRDRADHVQRQIARAERDVVGAQGADCVANRQTAGQNGQLHVAARGGDAAGGHGRGAVGHGADGEGVGVGVSDCPVVVGGQRGHVVAAVVERDRAAAQELQAGGRDDVVGRLRDRANHVQRQIACADRDLVGAQGADCAVHRALAVQNGQLDVVARGGDSAGGHGGGA